MSYIKYVVGFLFRNDMKEVALIKKNRPAWQVGKLNGIGGKIEEDETPYKAMVREFREEAGIYVPDWVEFAQSEFESKNDPGGVAGIIHFFKANHNGGLDIRSTESEEVGWYETSSDYHIFSRPFTDFPYINNLEWQIPLAKCNKYCKFSDLK